MGSTPSARQSTSDSERKYWSQRGFLGTSTAKLGILVLVGSVVALAAYFAAQEFLLNDDAETDDRRPVAVDRGTFLDDVTASGSVSFPEVESLRFEIAGTVGELLVGEGDQVSEGQQLILLDDITIASLESNVASAELDLKEAGEELAEILGGATSLERAVVESDLADARVASMDAASELAEFTSKDGLDSPATLAAKDDLIDANEDLADVVASAEDENDAATELVDAAQEDFDDALSAYSEQISGWFGSIVSASDQITNPTELFESWGTTVDDIFEESLATVDSPPDNTSTPWNESVVWVWTHLTPYPILTNCEYTLLTARCPLAEITEAWDAKVAAEEELIEEQENSASVAKAQQSLIDAAQDAVADAAEAVVGSNNDIEIAALAATLAEKLELEKEVERTLADLDELDTLGVKIATAAVNQAAAELDNAKKELEAANLMAPFAGTVTSISVAVGDTVNRNTPTIDVLDESVITVEGTIDEVDVLSLRVGDSVAVTLDALPGQVLEGVVDEIGDGVNQQGVIEFPLTVAIAPLDGVELIEGLSATATIVLNQIDDALLIPLQAVGGSFTQPTVDVVTESGFTTTEVELGASDDFWVVVESGLSEGQEVLMTVADSVDPLQQLFGGGNVIRLPGGGATETLRIPGAAGGRGGQR